MLVWKLRVALTTAMAALAIGAATAAVAVGESVAAPAQAVQQSDTPWD